MMGELGRLLGIEGDAAPIDTELAERQELDFRDKMIKQEKRMRLNQALTEMQKENNALKEEIKRLKEELNAKKNR